jgi:hypothetical protein
MDRNQIMLLLAVLLTLLAGCIHSGGTDTGIPHCSETSGSTCTSQDACLSEDGDFQCGGDQVCCEVTHEEAAEQIG